MTPIPYKEAIRIFLRFSIYLVSCRNKLVLLLVLSALSVGVNLVNPYLSKLVVDQGLLARNIHRFITLGLFGAILFVVNGILRSWADFLDESIRLKLTYNLNKKIFKHLHYLPLAYFNDKSTGEHMFRFQYDIETIINLLISVPKDAVLIIPSLICTLAMVFYLDWQCAVFALLVSPLVYVPFYYFARKTHRILSQLYENSEQVYQILEETLSHIYLIKAFGREKKEIRSYLSALVTMIRLSYKNIGLRIASNFSAEGVNKLSLGLIALFGGFQVMRGRISLGSLAAIMVYLTQLIMLQTRCLSFFQQLVSGIFSCRRIEDLLRTPVDDRTLQCGRPFKNTCIQFSKVDFQYTPAREIIAQLDMRMESGYVALVGPSGCGKTTIINLILGLYKPQHGTITVGGYTTHDILPVSSRGEISVALQEPYLHNDTILNNIRYAKTDAGMEEIRRIACAAGVEEFVRKLDKGYETRVGENACKFSEGQKQKISIARALLPRPKILILDEAMSSMDSLSEERIIANIRAFNIPLVIFVSHRLSTVMMADVVYYLKSPSEIIVQKPRDAVHADQSFKSLFAAQNLAGG